MDHKTVQEGLRAKADKEIAQHSTRFFKTGDGEYGEGDKFLGIRVPRLRKVAKYYKGLSLSEVEQLLHSDYHEERLTALFILTYKFEKADKRLQKEIYKLYMKNLEQVNNWDMVDGSAPKIVGPYLEDRDRSILFELAESKNIWERRIAIMSCMHFIKQKEFDDALDIAEKLLHDHHDLIHKAVGWMLREVGNIDLEREEHFLQTHDYKNMPRTMLRYAIEKFPEEKRQAYLSGKA